MCVELDHEGVMIQCETCKVWQHCHCVGLGGGSVTPDKYYCDSCRPHNHPYKVQNGILISGSKRAPQTQQVPSTVPSLKTPVPKKRNTMNSKEASIPVDLLLAQQKWNDEHMDEIDDISHKHSKRRKKNGSSTHDDDEEHLKSKDDDAEAIKLAMDLAQHHSENKKASNNSSNANNSSSSSSDNDNSCSKPEKDTSSGLSPIENSPSSNSQSRNGGSKKSNKSSSSSSSASRLRSPTPMHSTSSMASVSPTTTVSTKDQKSEEPPADVGTLSSGKRTTTADEDAEEAAESPSRTVTVSSSKRRKTAKSDVPARSALPVHDTDHQEEPEQVIPKTESNTVPRSRKNGLSRSYKRNGNNTNSTNMSNNNSDQEENADDEANQTTSTPTTITKRSFLKRNERNHRSSRNSTPVPNTSNDSGTPQPMSAPAPATVRYPNSKMTIQEMNKRAKQLLGYISRVQIDMADRKSKSGCNTPCPPVDEHLQTAPHTTLNANNLPFSLPSAIKYATVSDVSLLHGARNDKSRLTQSDTHCEHSENKEMTIKVPLPSEGRDSMLLSTPPLSVHDISHLDLHHPQNSRHIQDGHDGEHGHGHESHRHRRHSGSDCHSGLTHSPESEFESSKGHEPITPPHQPVELNEKTETVKETTVPTQEVQVGNSSLELMDRLTGALIRFQERFGAFE
ncbi:hypothetical protein BG004_002184 [Podila humilis]|nr:hypothetical protein BG004_002184 [Podila humilis]